METVLKSWKLSHVSYGKTIGRVKEFSYEARTDGSVIQKAVEKTLYETPYDMPLEQWMDTLKDASEGIIEPAVTILSYDGGEHHGFYDAASSEVIVKGWTEDLTDEELQAGKDKFGL